VRCPGRLGWEDAAGSLRHVVHALDLGLLVPLGLATAVLLIRRRPSGYLLAGIQLTVSACMSTALTAMVVASGLAAGKDALDAMPFAVFAAGTAFLARTFLRTRRPASPAVTPAAVATRPVARRALGSVAAAVRIRRSREFLRRSRADA
jgi:hypothetical protein